MTPLQGCLLVSALLFAIGLAGAVTRRNAILALVGIELMLNAANLNFIAFWRFHAGAAPAHAANPGFQPGCGLVGGYKATPLAIPETFNSVTSIALTAQFQITPKLEFDGWAIVYT